MQALAYRRYGNAADVLRIEDIPCPAPQAGEVTVDLAFSGVNPSDVKARAGARAGAAEMPFPLIVPHSDGAGVISAIGEGVAGERLGQRVWIWNGQWRRALGTAAAQITLPAAQAVPLPDNLPLETGAVLGIPGLTAAHAVFGGGDVSGRTVLVQGGAGTVGHLAMQLARRGGARTIATARGRGLDQVRGAGADAALDFESPDLAQEILAANGGHPVDRIIEVEFGRNIATDTEVIAENGTICAYGSALAPEPGLPFYPLLFKAVTVELMLVYLLPDAARAAAIRRLHDALRHGALDCPVAAVFDLADGARAHDAVAAGAREGAILLRTA
ncbi:NADPH:quinone reductase [Pontibaca methylaminivorans]|uniref:NADPH2:quinone reductase n=1 Tax=Pontibaca methylaminivorans TaxID=515897 RepID=A0A1R3WY58_9RHOB|nr:NADPH:quinone reductase [Pontibaca methylaminivorans]SIT82673.1 NADPH2:quinone reductase [Pontibaca methylaminivorans]